MCYVSFSFSFLISLGEAPSSPDLFPPAQRRRMIVIDSDDDDDTQDAFVNGQNLFADEGFVAPPSPPANVSPIQEDYLTRVEREIRDRWDDEFATQMLSPGYMRTLRDMFERIDEWLGIGGGVAPFPISFKRFMRHNWCFRKLPRSERIRINNLRLRHDMILEDEDARKEAAFWEEVERNEPNARNLLPACSICRFDLRNESFTIQKLNCGHMFHTRCIERHLDGNRHPRCPNCNEPTINAGERVHLNYQ